MDADKSWHKSGNLATGELFTFNTINIIYRWHYQFCEWGPSSPLSEICGQTSNISHTLKGNKAVYHSDVFGASPAPTTSLSLI